MKGVPDSFPDNNFCSAAILTFAVNSAMGGDRKAFEADSGYRFEYRPPKKRDFTAERAGQRLRRKKNHAAQDRIQPNQDLSDE